VFGTTGSNTLQQLGMKNAKQVKKEFEKDIKSFVVSVEGQSFHTSHIQLPKDEKSNLNLMHRYLLLQLNVLKGTNFHIELRVRDTKQQKHRLIFSTNFSHTQKNTMHTQLPLGEYFIGNSWINACFDLADLCEHVLECKYHCLDTIIIGPTCKLRKIFTMKQHPIHEVFIPQKLNFPPSVSNIPDTIMITSEHFGETNVRTSGEHQIEPPVEEPKPKTVIVPKRKTGATSATTPTNNAKQTFSKAPKTAGVTTRLSKIIDRRNSRSAPPKKEATRYSQEALAEPEESFSVSIPKDEEYNAENYAKEVPDRSEDDDLESVVQKSLRISEEKRKSLIEEQIPEIVSSSMKKSVEKSFETRPRAKTFDISSSRSISKSKEKDVHFSTSPLNGKTSIIWPEKSSELVRLPEEKVTSSIKQVPIRMSAEHEQHGVTKYTPKDRTYSRPDSSLDLLQEHNGSLSSSYLIDPYQPKKSINLKGYDFPNDEETVIQMNTKSTPFIRKQPSFQKMSQQMKKYISESVDDDDMVNMEQEDENPLDQFDQIFDTPRSIVVKDKTSLGKLEDRYAAIDEEDKVELAYDDMIGCYYDPKTNKYYEMKE
jgi:hypothetical protein